MANKRLYRDKEDRAEQFRRKKKEAGLRAVQVYVPHSVYMFINRQPARLLKAFLEHAKNEYIEFDRVKFVDSTVILENGEGITWELKDDSWEAGRVKAWLQENPSVSIRLHPNGILRPA